MAQPIKVTKVCSLCGQLLPADSYRTVRYCSDDCRTEARKINSRKRTAKYHASERGKAKDKEYRSTAERRAAQRAANARFLSTELVEWLNGMTLVVT